MKKDVKNDKKVENNKKLEKSLTQLTKDYHYEASIIFEKMLQNVGIEKLELRKNSEYNDNDYYTVIKMDCINGIGLIEGESYYYENEFDEAAAKTILLQIENEEQAKELAENRSCEGINTDDAGEVEIQIGAMTYLNKCSLTELLSMLTFIPWQSEDLLNHYCE